MLRLVSVITQEMQLEVACGAILWKQVPAFGYGDDELAATTGSTEDSFTTLAG